MAYAIQQRFYHVGKGWSEWSIDLDRTFDNRNEAEESIEDDNLSDTAQYRVVEIDATRRIMDVDYKEAAYDYAIAQFQARSDVKHTQQAMLSICWYNGYDLAAAFAAGVNFHAKVWQEEVHKICNGIFNFYGCNFIFRYNK